MDDASFNILQEMSLVNVELIPLKRMEDEKLLSVKQIRNAGEYSWTTKPYLVLYIFEKYPNTETLIYLDADLFFFSSPAPIYEELKNNSIILTPHYFIKGGKELEKKRGKYNAGFIFFKNDKISKKCLLWWREKCLEWCYHRLENGKLGDQMYLNHWQRLFKKIHNIKHPGVNIGPWRLVESAIKENNNKIFINETPLILFHFHNLQIFPKLKIYTNRNNIIYKRYYKELKKAINNVKKVDQNFKFGFSSKPQIKTIIKHQIAKLFK
ncbi:hypothetical protein A2331_02690 [Candidatus Falkowbacteria bacterium RIFOXYB2_FULL_34_18]|nr:MAG: hypothetical protein A2331_02690 [Candidatus Falkowbacteria bacterium RIFOXYB2_FULL_34_18]OGF29648.1 MAG: hypothetical protein A2500_00720 [Candidatus Falkowbacteria bacterium RIFOXYC12_FULL_34_55]OGF37375.1 MAG: hypothetical protein A2466_01490 [Candidatus Falkowbacteria bacterium RIFOXYC2_FULL_34_220]OGF39113.1 MAG: hypothetical protein A2515_00140 [Candidatus Falkowbacteria bacterium RIFOXYD12_FULL_34_57]